MILNLKFRDRLYQIGSWFVQEMDGILTAIRSAWDVEHNDDGSHSDIHANSLTITKLTPQDIAQGKGTGNVTAEGYGSFDNVVSQRTNLLTTGTGGGVAMGTLQTGDFATFLPGVNARAAVLLGDLTAGMVLTRQAADGAFTGALFELGLWNLGADATKPALQLAKDAGVETLIDGGTGSLGLALGNLNRPLTKVVAGNFIRSDFTPGMGMVAAWTPTWTNFSQGNGSVTGTYTRVGNMVWIEVVIVFGTTTTIAGGVTLGSLPVNNVAGSVQSFGINYYYDSSSGFTYYGSNQPASASTMFPLVFNIVGAQVSQAQVTPALPFVWATGDQFYLSGWYRAA